MNLRVVPVGQEPSEEFNFVEWACRRKPAHCDKCFTLDCLRPPDPRTNQGARPPERAA